MYRPEGCREWDKRWKHARDGLDSWVQHRDIFEAGADAIVKEIALKLQEIYNIPDSGAEDKRMGEFIQELMEL